MTNKVKPDWTGNDLLSRFVNLMIETKPIYRLMTHQARKVIIKTAEKNGIAWEENCKNLEKSPAKSLFSQITNPDIVYPDYYLVPFHAYDQGNLCWKAAFEAVPATQSLGLRVWKNEDLTWQEAQDRFRAAFHAVLEPYSPPQVENILDIGCSIGVSTKATHRYYSQRQGNLPINTIGLDLSPYMLAVAKEQALVLQQLGVLLTLDEKNASIDVVATPALLQEKDPRALVESLLGEFLEYGDLGHVQTKLHQLFATMACHQAIRANRLLNLNEMNALLREIEKTQSSDYCNHGRPTWFVWPYEKIDSLFSRGQ